MCMQVRLQEHIHELAEPVMLSFKEYDAAFARERERDPDALAELLAMPDEVLYRDGVDSFDANRK